MEDLTRFGGTFLPDDEPDAFEPIITIGVRYRSAAPHYRLDICAASEFGLELHVAEKHSDAALRALCMVAPSIVQLDEETALGLRLTPRHLRAVRSFVTAWRSFIRCNEIPLGALNEVPYAE